MNFFLPSVLAFSILAFTVNAQTPNCVNLGPFDISGSINTMVGSSFSGTLDVLNPSDGTDVELFLDCSVCTGTFRDRVCDCRIVTKLSVGFGAIRGVSFTYGVINFNQDTNTLMIAGGGDDLRGGYGTFTITDLSRTRSTIDFTANLDPCIFGGVNPFLPSVQITATASGNMNTPGRLEITCSSATGGKSCTVFGNRGSRTSCSIDCIPGESLSVSCKANNNRRDIDDFEVGEKITYGSRICSSNGQTCTYETTVFNFDTDVECAYTD